ncbi:MAG: ATP-binding cassette domain-containing protein [Brevibacterium sp.]|uniref:ABC transporter ATP-binding protein n=1 Tax=Brevibacterium sp. TaxID=1701 RepID=UPI0026499D9D|nr:ATP-binding cassette domain-containing protein [Brevibacterium sp.]MDN6134579.1 ATP-binding cassette domain-containing protein [Brevibacterium sp.]MDN6176846.1 ATP-binding cassette domain-containing protein [Brevibacterium sp.]MDN6189368.1 ATP-binding cassette domain-containing protein [Brevibacterium sp.]MDN6605138.1 ATP-binding cassette domain-containing protein [Brevibacterium sp.]
MLTLKEVSLRKGKRTYLDEVSFTAQAGRITAIVGPRSAGRTELVRVIMGLIAPDEGTVKLEDFELDFGDRQNFGYLPSERGGYPNMRVIDQIVYLARLHGITLGAAERNALTLLSRLELADRGYAPLKNLSGTEIARVDIAATLAADPDVVVIDDAFSGLDSQSTELVISLLRAHAASGVPVIVATDNWEAAQAHADDVVVLNQGRTSVSGSVQELRSDVKYRVEVADAEAAAESLDKRTGISDVAVLDSEDSVISFRASDADSAAQTVAALNGVKSFESVRPTLAEQYKEAL